MASHAGDTRASTRLDLREGDCPARKTVAEVDFARQIPVHSLVGFLTSQTTPPMYVAPLKPSAWRANLPDYAYLKRFNDALLMQSSSKIAFAIEKGREYQTEQELHDFVREWMGRFRDIAPHVVLDMQNEPDAPGVSRADAEKKAFSSYLTTYRAARSVTQSVRFTGPNTTKPDMPWIVDLMEFCLREKCEVNFLCWHFASPWDTRSFIERVDREIVHNPRYAPLRLQGVIVSEFTGPEEQFDPAASLSYFYHMEKAGVVAAMKSCWEDNCFGRTLDGLLDAQLHPRPVWYVWKYYGEGVASRVFSETNDKFVPVLASRRSGDKPAAQILAGYYTDGLEKFEDLNLEIHIHNLPSLASFTWSGAAKMSMESMKPEAAHEGASPDPAGATIRLAPEMTICVRGLRQHAVARVSIEPR